MLSEQRVAHTYAIFVGSPVDHDGVRGDYGAVRGRIFSRSARG
jgi:hypothetical protein